MTNLLGICTNFVDLDAALHAPSKVLLCSSTEQFVSSLDKVIANWMLITAVAIFSIVDANNINTSWVSIHHCN